MLEDIIRIFMTAALGGLIGLEREMRLQKTEVKFFGGFRTFSMIALLGYLAMYTEKRLDISHSIIVILIAIVSFLLVDHIIMVIRENHFGLTSILSALACFLVGTIMYGDKTLIDDQEKLVIAILISILFVTLLSFRDLFHKIAKNFTQEEFYAILKFLIVTGVILPILPDQTLDKWEIFNPRKIWLMIALVASLRFIGFFLTKIFGQKKSIILSGIFGGLMSSTAVTISLAQQNKKLPNIIGPFLTGILCATAIMFVRIFMEVQILYPDLAKFLIVPLFTMAIISGIMVIITFFIKSKKIEQKEELTKMQPFSLVEALKFGIFFVIVLTAVKILPQFIGNTGLYATALISGLADADAITLSVVEAVKFGNISFLTGSKVIILAVIVNTIVKAIIVGIFGGKKLAVYVFLAILLIIISGGLSLLVVANL